MNSCCFYTPMQGIIAATWWLDRPTKEPTPSHDYCILVRLLTARRMILWQNRVISTCFPLRITFACPSKFKLKSNFPTPRQNVTACVHFRSSLSFSLPTSLSYFKHLHPVIYTTIVNKRGLDATSLAPLWFSIYCLLVTRTGKNHI